MPKQRTYYCPVCDGELWPTPCEKWYACPNGHTKLIPKHKCETRNRAEREEAEVFRKEALAKHVIKIQEEADRIAKLEQIIPDLPIAGIEAVTDGRRAFDIWWVLGMDGKFQLVNRGKLIDGCVHAYDPTYKTYRPERVFRIVSLKKLSQRQLLYRADLLVKETK